MKFYKVKPTTGGKWCIHNDGFMDDMYVSQTGFIEGVCTKSCLFETEEVAEGPLSIRYSDLSKLVNRP